VDGVEAGDPFGASEMTGPDQVGLLKVSHRSSSNMGIGRAAWSTLNFDLLCLAGPSQDLFDGRDGREPTYSLPVKLEMDRFGADAGEGGTAGLVGRQFVAQGQDFSDQRRRRLVRNPFRRSALVLKPIESKFPIATESFGEPSTASMDTFHGVAEPAGFFIDSNGFEPDFIFTSLFHDRLLLPIDFGRSVGDSSKCSRCLYGNPVELYPDDQMANIFLGNIYENLEEWDKALEKKELYAKSQKTILSYYNLAVGYQCKGLY
jgi:hypothetical protein